MLRLNSAAHPLSLMEAEHRKNEKGMGQHRPTLLFLLQAMEGPHDGKFVMVLPRFPDPSSLAPDERKWVALQGAHKAGESIESAMRRIIMEKAPFSTKYDHQLICAGYIGWTNRKHGDRSIKDWPSAEGKQMHILLAQCRGTRLPSEKDGTVRYVTAEDISDPARIQLSSSGKRRLLTLGLSMIRQASPVTPARGEQSLAVATGAAA